MISLKLIWASARSATPGTLHKTLGASRTLNHHCPVQAKAVVESREVQTCIVLMSRHATGIRWHITTVMCCIHAAMLLQHGWMTFWGWNEDKMSRINSLVLQGRGKCSYLAVQTAFWAQNLCQREKKKKNKTKQPNQLCLGPHYTLLLMLEQEMSGSRHRVGKSLCEKIFVPYLSNVKCSQYHKQGTQSLLSPISTSAGSWPVTSRSRTRWCRFVLGYLFCRR